MNPTVLITGTTSGIGAAFCEKYASKHYNLILVSRNQNKLLLQKKQLEHQYNIKVFLIPCDLEMPVAAKQIYQELEDNKLQVDILINNAGFNEYGTFNCTDTNRELAMVQLHISFLTEFTKLILTKMLERNCGTIVIVGSTGSYIPCPRNCVYAATKAYALFFAKALCGELKGSGVKISCVCPGSTATEFSRKAHMDQTLLFKFFVMSADQVAALAYPKIQKGKLVIVTGLYNKLLILSAKLLPTGLINWISGNMLA